MDPNKTDEQEFAGQQDGLTDEERAALAGDEDQGALPVRDWEKEFPQTANDPEAAERAAAEAGDEDEGDDAASTAGADTAAAGDSGTPAPTAEAADDAPATRPLLVAEVPEGADERLKAIATEKQALLDKLDEGDLTVREYQTQVDALMEEKGKLELAIHTANMADQMERQRLQSEWETTVHSFLRANADYQKTVNPILFSALDLRIREIAASEEGANLTNLQILERARDDVDKAVGRKPKAEAPTSPPPPPPSGQKPAAPPTLAHVPAADITASDEGGKWAVLDRLASADPLRYEEEIGKLSEADRDAYMRAR